MTTDPTFVCEIPGHARCTRGIRDGEFWVTHHAATAAAGQDDLLCCSNGEHDAPPADDVREALALAIRRGSGASRYQSELLADQMLPHLAFEVRPRKTVTDAEVDAAYEAFWSPAYARPHDRVRAALEAAARVRAEEAGR